MKQFIFLILLISLQTSISAQTSVSNVFGNHMVLQQNTEVKIWGKDQPKQKIEISTSWGEKVKVITNKEGNWNAKIPTPKGSYESKTLSIKGSSIIKLEDILIGEVWLASGQSNMQMPLQGYLNQPVINAREEIVEANKPNYIRLFQVVRASSPTPEKLVDGKWELCNANTVREFSAVAYIFGQQLSEQLQVPIGLIHASRGGTKAECWISEQNIVKIPIYKNGVIKEHKNEGRIPTIFYNKMIHPLEGYTIKGAIWYQGEANRMESVLYPEVMKTLISSWRSAWNQGDFPFYMVEIAPFKYDGIQKETAARLRESQLQITFENEKVGLVSTSDLGSLNFIHPPQKIEIGKRLSYLALFNDYQKKGFDFTSPIYETLEIKEDRLKVKFKNAPHGITSFQKEIIGFEIAGEDEQFYPAKAKIINKKEVGVWLTSEQVPSPKYARYAFKNYHEANLFSTEGMPVFPFRSDKKEKQ